MRPTISKRSLTAARSGPSRYRHGYQALFGLTREPGRTDSLTHEKWPALFVAASAKTLNMNAS